MNHKKLFCLLLLTTLQAKHFSIKPKVGAQLSQLHLSTKSNQLQPVFALSDPAYPAEPDLKRDANSFFFNTDGTRGSISKENIDGSILTQLMAGIQIGYDNEPARPNTQISYAPVANVYALLEDKTHHAIQADRFVIAPLTTVGADIGIEMALNGSYLQLGAGGQLYRCDYHGGKLFNAMSTIQSNTVDTADIDTKSLIPSAGKSYKESVDPFIMPYAYAEINSEVGDLLAVFLRLGYGFEATPAFKDADPTIELFSKDPHGYAANSSWKMNTASFGAKIRLEDIF